MLTVKNLNIFYGRKQIIENASFSIKPGEIVGLIGPNGAGKTTIMKTLLGLTKFPGSITFNNQPITANNHKALQNVGALIENPAIYPFLSGKDNLSLYSTDKGEVAELITKLQMNSYIERQAKSYSIGMKQKLGIALALLNHPQFVILDEPMNGLDIETTILIRKIIHEYAHKGTEFLISSHVLSELLKVMTSVIILNQGHIIMDVPVSQFQERDSQQYRLVTTDNQAALKLLTANSITVIPTSTGLIVNKDALSQIQQILFKNRSGYGNLFLMSHLSRRKSLLSLKKGGRIQMGNNLSQEIYKFTHQRTSLYGLLVMIALMLYSSIPAYKVNPFLITQGFGAIQWCAIIMVAVRLILFQWNIVTTQWSHFFLRVTTRLPFTLLN